MDSSVRLIWAAIPDPTPAPDGRLRVNVAVGFVAGGRPVEQETDADVLGALRDWPAHVARLGRLRIRVRHTQGEFVAEGAIPDGAGHAPVPRSSPLWREFVRGQVPTSPSPAVETPAAGPASQPSAPDRVVHSYPAHLVGEGVRQHVVQRVLQRHLLDLEPDAERVQDLWDVTDGLETLRPYGAGARPAAGSGEESPPADVARGWLETARRMRRDLERAATAGTARRRGARPLEDWDARWQRLRGGAQAGSALPQFAQDALRERLRERTRTGGEESAELLARSRAAARALPRDGSSPGLEAAGGDDLQDADDLVRPPFTALQEFHGSATRRLDPQAGGPPSDASAGQEAPSAGSVRGAGDRPCPDAGQARRTWEQRGFLERVSIARNHLPLLERLGLAIPLTLDLSAEQAAALQRDHAVAGPGGATVEFQCVHDDSYALGPISVSPIVVCGANPVGGWSPAAHPEIPWMDRGFVALSLPGDTPGRFMVEALDVDNGGMLLLAEAQAAGELPEAQLLTTCGGDLLGANAAARALLMGRAGASLRGITLGSVLHDDAELAKALRTSRRLTAITDKFSPRLSVVLKTRRRTADGSSLDAPLTWVVERACDVGLHVAEALRWRIQVQPGQMTAAQGEPPALRTRGVSLIQEDRDLVVETLYVREKALRGEFDAAFRGASEGTRGPAPRLYASDVLLGVLGDAWVPPAVESGRSGAKTAPRLGRWCCLSDVVEEYDAALWAGREGARRPGTAPELREPVDTQAVLRPGVWERFDAAAGYAGVPVPQDQTAPALLSFDGMNLGASPSFDGWRQTQRDDDCAAAAAPDGSPVLERRAARGTLPPLHFRRCAQALQDRTWIRARTVDLAGKALPLQVGDLGPESSRLEYRFQRYEPVLPPTVLVGERDTTLTEWPARGPREMLVDGTRSVDVRWLAPPGCDAMQVERHGLGDVIEGRAGLGCLGFGLDEQGSFPARPVRAAGGERDAGTVPVYSGRGVGTDQAQPGWPYFPDPMAGVARVSFVPDFALLPRRPLECWASFFPAQENWPEARPIRLAVLAAPAGVSEPTLRCPDGARGQRVELVLPAGWSGTLHVSCGTGEGRFADRMLGHHALLCDLEERVADSPPGGAAAGIEAPTLETPARGTGLRMPAAAKLRALEADSGTESAVRTLSAPARRSAVDATQLRTAMQRGQLPGINPTASVRVAHPVALPSQAPQLEMQLLAHRDQRWEELGAEDCDLPERVAGAVGLRARVRFDARTTSRVEIHAAWEETLDGAGWLASKVESRSCVVGSVTVDAHPCEREGAVDLLLQHVLPGRGHVRVAYRALAVSRYSECFPERAAAQLARESAPAWIDVLCQERPAPVLLDRLVPTFSWSERLDEDPSSREPRFTVVRHGGLLRVRVARPWPTTGPGQLLGVVLSSEGVSDADLRDLAPGGDGDVGTWRAHVRDETLLDVVSTWAWDPVAPPGRIPGALRPTDLGGWRALLRVTRASVQPQGKGQASDWPAGEDAASGAATGDVLVLGYALREDATDGTWYADVSIREPRLYGTFVRLSLVRLQPKALDGDTPLAERVEGRMLCRTRPSTHARGDFTVSTRVLTPLVELPVERELVHWLPGGRHSRTLVVSLRGARSVREDTPIEQLEAWGVDPMAPRSVRPANRVRFGLYAEVADANGDVLYWSSLHRPPFDASGPVATIVPQPPCVVDEIARCEVVWEEAPAPRTVYLVVREFERYKPDEDLARGAPAPLDERPVYAGVVELSRRRSV